MSFSKLIVVYLSKRNIVLPGHYLLQRKDKQDESDHPRVYILRSTQSLASRKNLFVLIAIENNAKSADSIIELCEQRTYLNDLLQLL